MILIYYILSLYGMSLIISEGLIFKSFRAWLNTFKNKFIYKMVSCMMCVGFWLGFITGLILNDHIFNHIYDICNSNVAIIVLYSFLFGCLISGTNWLLHLIQLNFEKNIKDEL